MKTYTFVREGVPEEVTEEAWGWGVVYRDGTELRQFGDDGVFHQFREIDQAKVCMFVMYRMDDQEKRYDMLVREGVQIFHFYRNFIFDAGQKGETKVKVYVFGWKDGDACAYHYILPNGRLMISPSGEGEAVDMAAQANA